MKIKLIVLLSYYNALLYSQSYMTDTAVIPAVAHLAGSHNSFWKTDLYLFNAINQNNSLTIFFYSDKGEIKGEKDIELKPFETIIIKDIVNYFFGYEGFGSLLIKSYSNKSNLGAYARTYTTKEENGTYSQGIENHIFLSLMKESYLFPLENTENFRTNIGILCLSLYTDCKFTIEIYDQFNNLLKKWNEVLSLYQLRQFPINYDLKNGYAKIVPNLENLLYVAYLSRIDNSTGDAIYVSGKISLH